MALLTDRVRHSAALSAGLSYLEKFERTEQQELIDKWLTSELWPAISPPRAFACKAGRHLGWAAMVRYDSGEPTGSHDAIRRLIAAPSAVGVLSDPSVHALFVGESVFGAKEALANGGVPLARAHEFASCMEECWRALVPSLSESEKKNAPAFALWVFHPILDEKNEDSSKLHLTLEDRHAWWRVLKPLAGLIVRDGPSREINSLLRCMKESPLLARIEAADIMDLLVTLRAKTASLTRETLGYYWDDAISCASSVIESIAANTADAPTRDQLYAFVATWAAPPLAIETAGAAAKRLRA